MPENQNENQAGLAEAEAEIAKDPQSPHSWNRAAILLLQAGNYPKAVEYISQAVRLEPEDADNYWNRGRILFELGRYEEALADYSAAIQIAPTAALYSSRSVVNLALGKDAAALGDLNDALELERTAQNLLNRASFFTNKGMAVDALRDMTAVIELEPTQPNHYLARANLAFALARHYPDLYDVGVGDVESALELDKEGALSPSMRQLADQFEAYLPASPNPAISKRLIELIRSKTNE
jgi:tetratricopeptide (TPR) repeat protein